MRKNWQVVLFFALYTLFAFIIVGITGQEAMINPLKQLDRPQDIKELNRQLRELRDSSPIDVTVGSFTCPAGTGNHSVTGIGFTPRYVDFKIGASNTDYAGSGKMDYNGNQSSFAIDVDGTNKIVCATDKVLQTTNYGVENFVIAAYVSMDADGFSLNFSVTSTAYAVYYTAVR